MGQQLCVQKSVEGKVDLPELKVTTLYYTEDPLRNTRRYNPLKEHNNSKLTHTISLVRNPQSEQSEPKEDSYKEDSIHEEIIKPDPQKINQNSQAFAAQQQLLVADLKMFMGGQAAVAEESSIHKVTVKETHSKVNLNPRRQQIIELKKKELGQFQNNVGNFDFPTGTMDHKFYTLSNNIVYRGQWLKQEEGTSIINQNDRIHGKGEYFLPDNSYLEAFAENNKINGYGRMININGDYYEGQFQNNQANGIGRYCQGDVVYNGGFKNNLPHGNGQEYTELYVFIGEFEHGYRKKGKLTWKHKKDDDQEYIYQGSFIENNIKPTGKLKRNGEIISRESVRIK